MGELTVGNSSNMLKLLTEGDGGELLAAVFDEGAGDV